METPNILIACEESQTICNTFRKAGYHAYSCDLQTCSGGHPQWHIIGDAASVIEGHNTYMTQAGYYITIDRHWDMIIAHPPCTMLSKVSAPSLSTGKHTMHQVQEAAQFFMRLYNAPSQFVAIENPIPLLSAKLPQYTQIINPIDYGHEYSKQTCLWLRNLPPLLPTHATCLHPKSWVLTGSSRAKRRSKTFQGIADAMAAQWLPLLF